MAITDGPVQFVATGPKLRCTAARDKQYLRARQWPMPDVWRRSAGGQFVIGSAAASTQQAALRRPWSSAAIGKLASPQSPRRGPARYQKGGARFGRSCRTLVRPYLSSSSASTRPAAPHVNGRPSMMRPIRRSPQCRLCNPPSTGHRHCPSHISGRRGIQRRASASSPAHRHKTGQPTTEQ